MGRLHPVLVHLPIGILLLAFGLECLARWRRRHDLHPAIQLALAVGALSAVAAAGTGWLLSRQGGYDDIVLPRHQWLGFGAAVMALLTWWSQTKHWYFPLFTASVAVLTVAGHFGGSLTHGTNYLFEQEPAPTNESSVMWQPVSPDSSVFAGLIQPLLNQKCLSCHKASRHKGDLRLDTPAFLLKGGKHGVVLAPGLPDSSTLLRRLRLPLHHDDHMPPAGKPQPDDQDIRLIEWWIKQGADFQVKIKDAALPPEFETLVTGGAREPQNPVWDIPVDAASETAVQHLRDLLVHVSAYGETSPWLSVSFAGQSQPGSEQWKALRRVSEQVIDLDLAFTDASNDHLTEFPHLIHLNLAHTAVTDAICPTLANMQYLESLNLTGTEVTDNIVEPLVQLPHLQRLYVWKTAVTPAGIERLRKKRPELLIETGAVTSDTTRLALRPPRLIFGRSFFSDTMHVLLNYPSFKGVSLYYTLDEAASPTTQSSLYRDQIVLRQTAHIRAFASKPGWAPSPLVDGLFVRKTINPVAAALGKEASPKYPAKGAASLIDGKIGGEQGADTWLGFEGEHLTATLDLGQTETIRRVFVHCLENNVSWIFKPVGIQVQTSADGKTFEPSVNCSFPVNQAMGEQKTYLLDCDLPKAVAARYVRVTVKSLLKNPSWHPGQGQKCWIFVDEIVVE